jgi:hypothetical protein
MAMETLLPTDERRDPFGRAEHELAVTRFIQPDDVTCGPTCLRKVYHYYGIEIGVEGVVGEIDRNEDGGTLAVYLGIAALRRGFRARIFTYDLRIFDPTWCGLSMAALTEKVRARLPHLRLEKMRLAGQAYLEYLSLGGEIGCEELTPALIKSIIDREHPVLAGLSATYLYRMPRERHDPVTHALLEDDVAGDAIGHFVVISGYEQWGRRFTVLDPSSHVPAPGERGRQVVDAQRLINAILLGDLTNDAVLLELWPQDEQRRGGGM